MQEQETHGLNATANDNSKSALVDPQPEKKSKKICYIVVGVSALVAVTLIIVLSLTLPSNDSGEIIPNPPNPAPMPVL